MKGYAEKCSLSCLELMYNVCMEIDVSYVKINVGGVKNELPLWGRYAAVRGLDGGDITIKVDGNTYRGNLHEIVRYIHFKCNSKTIVKSNER